MPPVRTIRPNFSSDRITEILASARTQALNFAAFIAAWLGAEKLARAIRRHLAGELRLVARELRAAIVLKALKQIRWRTHAPRPRHPLACAAGCRLRIGFSASKRRVVYHIAVGGAGLAARDPRRLSAAIAHVAENADVYAARLVKRILRGFTPNALVMTRPPAIAFATNAPAPAAQAADTS